MNQTGDAAEQIVSMATNVGLKGVEVVSNLAGKGMLSLATFLIAALKDQKRTKGKARMQAFNGKPTKVFVIKASELKQFAEEAKQYGVLYAAVINKRQPDGLCDIVVNANDAAKVNRIAERFELSTVNVEKIRADIKKAREAKAKQPDTEKERTKPPAEKEVHSVDDAALYEMLGGSEPQPQKMEHRQPTDLTGKMPNPTQARTENPNPSAPSFGSKEHFGVENSEPERARPSVRRQIREIKEERQAAKSDQKQTVREKAQQTVHKQPIPKKKIKVKGR
jgi:hypothetical protein